MTAIYYSKEEIEKAREMDLLTYLRMYEPENLVRLHGNVYCTRQHDSLKISNGKWMWWSRGFGGSSALDYLTKVKGDVYKRQGLKEHAKAVLDAIHFGEEYQIAYMSFMEEFFDDYAISNYLVSNWLMTDGQEESAGGVLS